MSTCFIFFNDPATTEIYTLSLHDALPICEESYHLGHLERGADALERHLRHEIFACRCRNVRGHVGLYQPGRHRIQDRKSTRLNSSHANISYAVFCLKKKIKTTNI